MRITPFVRWYDLWIGLYIDTDNDIIYICPIPCIGIAIDLKPPSTIKAVKGKPDTFFSPELNKTFTLIDSNTKKGIQ